MPSYKEFAQKARERFLERQKRKASGDSSFGADRQYYFTSHAEYKMQQYGLSKQRVKSVIRNPKRKEEGIVPKTAAVMQPVSVKMVNGKETWKQEIWVMFVRQQPTRNNQQKTEARGQSPRNLFSAHCSLKIISAWRYPGVSPKRNPIPDEILRELEEGSILEDEGGIGG